jgi:hypothetical protein
MEEMLCSLASPCFVMWVGKGGQYKSRRNVITFPQDISVLCTTLPRMPEQLDILIVRKLDARDPAMYRDFRVRKEKVLKLLRYLKQHNPYYANISILPADRVDLPADGPVLHHLPHVQSTGADDEALDNTDPEEHSTSFVPDSLSQEHNMFVPDFHPALYEVDAIQNGIQEIGIKTTPSDPVPWPAFGPPLSEYSTEGLFSPRADTSVNKRANQKHFRSRIAQLCVTFAVVFLSINLQGVLFKVYLPGWLQTETSLCKRPSISFLENHLWVVLVRLLT